MDYADHFYCLILYHCENWREILVLLLQNNHPLYSDMWGWIQDRNYFLIYMYSYFQGVALVIRKCLPGLPFPGRLHLFYFLCCFWRFLPKVYFRGFDFNIDRYVIGCFRQILNKKVSNFDFKNCFHVLYINKIYKTTKCCILK